MKWKCPECGLENSDTFLECTCGYAFHKILGVKPGSTREEVRQTYQYLQKVWEENIQSQDPVMKQKAQERIKKIEEAYNIYKHLVTGPVEGEKRTSFIKIASIAGIAIIVLVGILIFFYVSRKDTLREQFTQVQKRDVIPSDQLGEQNLPEGTRYQYFEEDYQYEATQSYDSFATDITSLSAEEKAIELVKRSQGINSFYADESQISNWDAKKIDNQRYLVSFTASKGSDTRGFYFDTNIKTGSVRHVTDRLELQKHGILYADYTGYRLDVTVPEYVLENTEFEANVMITGKPNMELPISEKMFFILSNGCEIAAIRGTTPRRLSDISTEYSNVRGTPRDPYIPSDEFIVLDSRGHVEIPVTMKAGSYSNRMPRVGTGSEGRGCILEVSVGAFAKVETWVLVEKE